MTDRGWAEARESGLTTVIDLRNAMERGRTEQHPACGPAVMAGINVVRAPTEDPQDGDFLAECGPWLDHPRSWDANLRSYPDKIARVLDSIAGADGPVLIHCAGGRDRTGMIGSILLVLAGATDDAVVANYEAGFRGAAQHRGHGLALDVYTGRWVAQTEEAWGTDELDAALAERRPALVDWLRTFDVEAYVLGLIVQTATLARLRRLLIR